MNLSPFRKNCLARPQIQYTVVIRVSIEKKKRKKKNENVGWWKLRFVVLYILDCGKHRFLYGKNYLREAQEGWNYVKNLWARQSGDKKLFKPYSPHVEIIIKGRVIMTFTLRDKEFKKHETSVTETSATGRFASAYYENNYLLPVELYIGDKQFAREEK